MTYRVSVFFYLYKVALRFEVGNYLFSCLIAVKSGVFAAFFGYFALAVDNEYRIKIMTSADFKVVGVVCGSYLNRACAEALFNVFVRYYGYFSAYKRENKLFADFVFIAFVIWIYRNGSVAEKCFWTCCCDDYFTASVGIRITDVPECALFIAVFNFCIGKCGFATRADIAYTESSVNEPVVVERNEYLLYCGGKIFVHSKTFSCPVTGRAECFELRNYTIAVFMLPFPNVINEFFSAEIIAGKSFFLAKHFLNLYLCCYSGVIRSGNPESAETLHSFISYYRILHRFVECMSHMELPSNVRRRDNDSEVLFVFVG